MEEEAIPCGHGAAHAVAVKQVEPELTKGVHVAKRRRGLQQLHGTKGFAVTRDDG